MNRHPLRLRKQLRDQAAILIRHTNEPHDRNIRPEARTARASEPAWMREAARSVAGDLRAFAARYPDRFEYRDGKLTQKRSPRS